MALFDIKITDNENRNFFLIQFCFSLLAVISNFIGFVSPYWIEAKSGAYALFIRIGLWTVCFDGYMRPDNYNRAYFGCFYIYYTGYDEIRGWLNPIWLYCVQFIASFGLICHGLVVFFLLCQVTGRIEIERLDMTRFLMSGHFTAGFALLCTMLGFVYGCYDSQWVPYPKFNQLSWGFATAIVSLLFTLVAFFTMLTFYLKLHSKKVKASLLEQRTHAYGDDDVPADDDRNVDDEIRKLASTSASRIYSQPGYEMVSTSEGSEQRMRSEVAENFRSLGSH